MRFIFSWVAVSSNFSTKFLVWVLIASGSFCATAQGTTKAQINDFAKSKKAVVSGQVFVVTKGSQNIKLGLVTVSAFPEKDVVGPKAKTLKIQQELKETALKRIDETRGEVVAAQQNLSATERELADVSALWKAVALKTGTEEETNYKAVLVRNEANEHTVEVAQGKVKIQESILAQIGTPKFALMALGESKYSAKSDADGRFEMDLPPGVYVLSAKATRRLIETSEEYLWLIRVDLVKGNKKVMLSNDNMIGTSCEECVQPPLL